MISKELTTYIESLIPKRSDLLLEMEEYAQIHHVPIMDLIGMEALLQILRLKKPKKILEIGTAIGYSAIRMAETVENITVYTIERDQERYVEAEKNIEKAHLTERIHIIKGDALESFEAVQPFGPFDALFIDAAKGQYKRFFELYSTLLSKDGLVLSDNVLFRGFVSQNEEEINQTRYRSMVKKLKNYNEWLVNHPNYQTTILPVGDGLAVSIKKGELE